jgi:ubiquinone/menaquinone biosynthesis C-methylase UbiE
LSSFNLVAPFYDRLKKIIFGDLIHQSSIYFFNHINPTDRVLILGGGTGQIIEDIPFVKEILYIELSDRMIDYASKKKTKSSIKFVNEDFLKFNSENKFDVIICPFFLDVFTENELEKVIQKTILHLNPKGKLLVTDFDPSNTTLLNKALLWCMFRFFTVFSKLENKKYNHLFENLEASKLLLKLEEKSWNKGFIKSQIYRLK